VLAAGAVVAVIVWPRAPSYSVSADYHQFSLSPYSTR
jgi:hypothetical protein